MVIAAATNEVANKIRSDIADRYLKETKRRIFEKLTPSLAGTLCKTPQRVQYIVDGTGEWIFQEEVFRKWGDSENGFLWISGRQGTGKTGLMVKFGAMAEKYEKADRSTDISPPFYVAHVYCDHQTLAKLDSRTDIIMCFWKQLVHSIDFKLDSKTQETLEAKLESGRFQNDQEEIDSKMDIFSQTLAQAGKVILILDGLDEVPEAFRSDLIKDLERILKQNKQCRLIVTSRPYDDIQRLLGKVPKYSLEAKAIDIKLYIEDRISRAGKPMFQPIETNNLRLHVIRTLTEKCQGSFLMAKLFMDVVLKTTTGYECKNVIEHLPKDAYEAYGQGLDRLATDYHKDSHATNGNNTSCIPIQALFWVAFSKAPMTDRQLKQALAIGIGDGDYNATKEVESSIDSLCGELVTIDETTREVRVAHKSITDYLVTDEVREKFFPSIREHIHIILMEYLMFECMREHCYTAEFKKKHPLAKYAVENWGMGLKEVLEPDTQVWKLTEKFLKMQFGQWNGYVTKIAKSTMASRARGWRVPDEALSPGTISGLHWVVTFDLEAFVPSIIGHQRLCPIVSPVSMTPLGLAAAQGRLNMVEILLENGAEINATEDNGRALRPPFYDAVFHGNREVVLIFLAKGADMTLRRLDNDESPLDLAYHTGRGHIGPVLAEHISNHVSTKAQELQFLIKGAFINELRNAIKNGLLVNLPCENGKRALDYANELRNQEIIDILVNNGATPKLIWPAFTPKSSSYPQHLPETYENDHTITVQKSWGPKHLAYVESPEIFGSNDTQEDWKWKSESESESESESNQEPQSEFGRDCDQGSRLERTFSRQGPLLLLEVPVDQRLGLPLQSIIFETSSKDQGWSSFEHQGTYIGSTPTWVDVRVESQGEESESFRIQQNVHASADLRLHTNIWNLSELELSSPVKARFMKDIRHGSKLKIFAHAWGGRGWTNEVSFVRVRLYGKKRGSG
ncbi:hypothetical protein ABKA04_002097 [Annulohypoxylon sp. FPYF3050]